MFLSKIVVPLYHKQTLNTIKTMTKENKMWELASEIATQIGLQVSADINEGKIDLDAPIYANDWGQELIYNALMGYNN